MTERYVLHEQRVSETSEVGAERMMMTSFLLIESESEKEEEIWLRKLLLLFLCDVREDEECSGMAFLRFMKRVQPLDVSDDALVCVYLL